MIYPVLVASIVAICRLGGESAIDNISDYLEIRKESEFYIN